MGFKVGAVELAHDELLDDMKSLGIEPPASLKFPATFKLDEKYAAHYDQKGFVLRHGGYEPAFNRTITKNQVVQLEKGD